MSPHSSLKAARSRQPNVDGEKPDKIRLVKRMPYLDVLNTFNRRGPSSTYFVRTNTPHHPHFLASMAPKKPWRDTSLSDLHTTSPLPETRDAALAYVRRLVNQYHLDRTVLFEGNDSGLSPLSLFS